MNEEICKIWLTNCNYSLNGSLTFSIFFNVSTDDFLNPLSFPLLDTVGAVWGMTQSAFILLNVQPGMLEKVREGLLAMDKVKEVHAVYGIYDLIVKIDFENMDELKNQVLNSNIILEGVKNSMTMICVNWIFFSLHKSRKGKEKRKIK